MFDASNDPQPSDELQRLEDSIRAAGNYVAPTDDLRPRVLEAAEEADFQRRGWRSGLRLLMLACVLWGLMWTCGPWFEKGRQAIVGPTSSELQKLAIELAPLSGSSDWGLVDAFLQTRSLDFSNLRD